MASNQAAYLDEAGARMSIRDSPMPQADANGIVIKNKALAINPVDWKIQDHGIFVKKFPIVLGCDVAGEVIEVGKDVKRLKKGDRVFAHTSNLATQKPEDGGFATYTHTPAATAAIIPSKFSFNEAVVLPLAIDTAAVGLYSKASEGFMGLPMPSLTPSPSDKTIVIWGGSGSVGVLATQLAVASGAKVIVTASQHNHDFCKKNGATAAIDYKSSSVVDDVVSAVKSAGGTFAGVYDTISEQDKSYKHVLPILEKLGGGNLAITLGPPENQPENVKIGNVFGMSEITHPIWENFLTPALESGLVKCLPEPMVIGKGLESVQKGLDENKKGVSAKKVVVDL